MRFCVLFESVGPSLQGSAHFLKPLYGLNIRVYSRIHTHLCLQGRDPKVISAEAGSAWTPAGTWLLDGGSVEAGKANGEVRCEGHSWVCDHVGRQCHFLHIWFSREDRNTNVFVKFLIFRTRSGPNQSLMCAACGPKASSVHVPLWVMGNWSPGLSSILRTWVVNIVWVGN